jgi:hypothetical protein
MTPRSPAGAVLAALAALAAESAVAQDNVAYRNITTGGPLRPGIYGRIEVRGSAPPPLVYSLPVVAGQSTIPAKAQPIYLYVPPGQIRKWKQHCAKWSACDQPVLFVRMDGSPSRWGQWRQRREQLALEQPH